MRKFFLHFLVTGLLFVGIFQQAPAQSQEQTYSDGFKLNREYFEWTKMKNTHSQGNNHAEKSGRTALLIGGVGLAISYVATAATGLAISNDWGYEGVPYYVIPVFGPFLQIQTTGSPYTELCVLSGVVQTGFFAFLVYGLIKNKKPPKQSSSQLVWAPIVSKNTNGLLLRLSF